MSRVLITNDDGIDAPGIHALAAAVREAGHDVVVAAPLHEASGMSSALTAVTEDGRIVVDHRSADVYGVAASPAYISVLAALGAFGDPPDMILSGINRGANAGHAVLHSGTVGAALTAANNGLRAMAVSLDVLNQSDGATASGGAAIVVPDDDALHWTTAATVAAGLLDWLAESPPGTVLNVNVPDRAEVPELRQATLAAFGQARMALAETGEGWIATTMQHSGEKLIPGTDLAWLAEGYATATVLRPPIEDTHAHIPTQRARVDQA